MNQKLIFFDIDGTLMGASRKVTEKNVEAIHELRKNGHKVFLCTGRSPASIDQSLIDIGFDGVVASAGSLVLINNEYVFENFINQYLLSEVMLLFTNHQVLFSLETKNAVYQAPGIKNFFDTINKERFKDNLELARTYEDREKNFKRKKGEKNGNYNWYFADSIILWIGILCHKRWKPFYGNLNYRNYLAYTTINW